MPSHTRVSYNKDKPWFTDKSRQLRLQKEETFRSVDRDCYKESKYKFSKRQRGKLNDNTQKISKTGSQLTTLPLSGKGTNYKPTVHPVC